MRGVRCALAWLAALPALPALAAAGPLLAPPPAGSYVLQHIMRVPDGPVQDSDASVHRLSEFTTGKLTLFSFIYTYCTDPQGCPLAYATLHGLKERIEADPALRGKVRFVSMSFDPEFDPPEAMRAYGGLEARDRRGLRWHFLTARSARELAPLLDGFGQDVSVALHAPGRRAPVLSHLLKVYLVDGAGSVREIYSTSYLQPALMLNDIRTLLLERRR